MFRRGIFCAFLCATELAYAGGFLLNEHAGKASGRGVAVTATVRDGSAMVYNPAGLAAADGFNVLIGTNLISASATFNDATSGASTDTESEILVIPNGFVHGKIDWIAIGVGAHSPFGTRLKWPASSPAADEIRTASVTTYFITPTIAFDLNDWVPGLKIGGGLDLVPASVRLERDIFFGSERGTAVLGGNAFGFGGRVGIMYEPHVAPEISLGVAYRSAVRIEFEGHGDFDAEAPYRSQLPPDGDVTAPVTLPASFLGGVAYRPYAGLEVEANVQWTDWSTFKQIDINLPNGVTETIPRNFKDTFTARGGVEYQFRDPGVDVRGGYVYDPSPVPANTLTVLQPEIDRHEITAGGTYHLPQSLYEGAGLRDLFIDVGVLWIIPGSAATSDTAMYEPHHKGEFDMQALVGTVSLGAQFGGSDKTHRPLVARK
jgi:long-chain fatty acid transport protein